MKTPIEQMLDDFDAKEPFACDRFVCLEEELNRDATLPPEQQQLLSDISLMAALEQMAILGLLSMDDARLHTVADGSYARVFAIMIAGRTVAVKTLLPRPQEAPAAAPADSDANRSDASIVISALAREQYGLPVDYYADHEPYRRGALDALTHEADVLEGMPEYLPMMRVSRDRVPYLLMKHIDGCALWRVTPSLPAEHADRLASEIVRSALAAQNASGHVQMDIKPANIVVDVNGSATVVDWGLSRPMPPEGEQISTGENAVGTPGYMAPEQMRGFVDATSPVYQLGCVLFEVWTKKCLMNELMQMASVDGADFTRMFQLVHRADHPERLNMLLQREFPDESGTAWRAEVLRAMLEHDPRNRTSLRAVAELLALHEDGARAGIGEMVRVRLTPTIVSPEMPGNADDGSGHDAPTQEVEAGEGE